MPLDDRSLLWVAALLYALAFGYGLSRSLKGKTYPRIVILATISSGFVIQTIGLYMRGLETMSCPLNNVFEIIQFVSWSAILIFLIIGPAFRVSLLGFFISGFSGLMALVSLLVPGFDTPDDPFFGVSPWIETHASMAIFSYGVFGLLAVTASMYMLQNYGLRTKRFQRFCRLLPSIVQLDAINSRLLLTGTAVLTGSLLMGAVYWLGEAGDITSKKLFFTIFVWLAYCALFALRWANKLVARPFAVACIAIYAIALLSLWPVDASRQGQHTELAAPTGNNRSETR